MSKIDELMMSLCPDGVEFAKLEDVCVFRRGTSLTSSHAVSGDVPVVSGGRTPAFYHNVVNRPAGCVTVASSGTAGYVSYWDVPIFCADSFTVEPANNNLMTKYIYYYLSNNQERIYRFRTRGAISHIYSKHIADFMIPVPPLPVQAEIVRILDKFTELISLLERELELRRKQYAYYCEKLLTFGDDVKRITLGQVGRVCMCKRIMRKETSQAGDVPFYKIGTFGGQPDAYISRDLFERYKNAYPYPRKGEVLISAAGTIGKTVIFDGEDAYFQDSNIVWIANNESQVLNRFLYYLYQLYPWRVTKGGTIKRLYNDSIMETLIPVPSLDEQRRIASMLDKFTGLISLVEQELTARRKQYSYYRDKLLTFTAKVL